jgi:uncharacterized RDD family membrane protein YckC
MPLPAALPPPPMPMPAAPLYVPPPPTTENVARPRPPAPPAPHSPKPFGEFTNPGAAGASAAASGGGFMDKWLPPIPDDAQPTGERGDFVTRLLAILIDSVPIFVIMIVFVVLSFVIAMLPGFLAKAGGCILGLLGFVVMVGYGWYFMPMWVSRYGATPGKKMMKLRIVPEDDPYGRLTFGQAIVRQLCHMLNFTIGYLLVFGAERKAVHDMITKSIVIKVDR